MVQRIISFNVSDREDSFREGKRTRDGKCVISGVVDRMAPYNWSLFEAAHIFPFERENLWLEWRFGRWITDINDTVGVSKINSCQNGILLRRDIHGIFDQYMISVDPDVSGLNSVGLMAMLTGDRMIIKLSCLGSICWD